MKNNKKILNLMSVSLLCFLALACATSPKGRNQLLLVGDGEMVQMGAAAFEELKTKQKIEKDPRINTYVKCVAQEVLREAQGFSSTWEVVVFRDDSANAFALPGGKVGVHTGLLKVAKTQDQLATVLGHEVGHVIARHSHERVSQGLATQGVLAVTDLLTKSNPNKGYILGLLGVGAQFGFLLPHSRTQESEADIIGLEIMARAGFKPEESVELWKNMSEGGASPPEFLSTHPAPTSRISNLTDHMAEARALASKSQSEGRRPNCRN